MKISVITVCWNSKYTIVQTMLSVLAQDYPDIEYIVIDGNSSDGTIDIIRSFAQRIDRIVIEDDCGIYHAMNKGIDLATGDLFCILNSDDVFSSNNVITRVAEQFKNNSNLEILLTDVRFVDFHGPDQKQLRYVSAAGFSKWKLRYGWMPPHPGVFMKTTVYKEVGPYKLGYKIAADYEYMVRILFKHERRHSYKNICVVNMKVGGVSTKGLQAKHTISQEIVEACKSNGVYTNYLLVSLRLPLKWFSEVFLYKLTLKSGTKRL